MKTKEKIAQYCKYLRLHHIKDHFGEHVDNAVKAKLSYQDFLLRVLEDQHMAKIDNAVNRSIKTAGFPMIRRIDEFDFSFQPQLDEKRIRELASLDFITQAQNIVFLGPPGVGKTHLAVALGILACLQRGRVRFYTCEQLCNELAALEIAGQLDKKLHALTRLDLLIIDELGYIELSKKTATLFFQLISKRYEKGPIIITSNKPFQEWGSIFKDDVIAGAIIDRIIHHCHTFLIQGKSYRMKHMLQKSTDDNY